MVICQHGLQAHSQGVAWEWQLSPMGNRMPIFMPPLRFFVIVYCCFIFVAKEKSHDILLEYHDIWNTRNWNFFQLMHLPFDSLNIEHEKSVYIFYHMIILGQFCHPWYMGIDWLTTFIHQYVAYLVLFFEFWSCIHFYDLFW